MTAPADTPPPPVLPPLLRRRDDGVLRGVCAAVGRSTGTDPVLWRVVVAVLVLFGGTGIVLYAAGWLLIPEQGADASVAERLVRGRALGRGLSTAAVVALVLTVGVLVLTLGIDGHDGVVPLLAVALLAYLVLRGQAPGLRLASPEEARSATPATDDLGSDRPAYAAPTYTPPGTAPGSTGTAYIAPAWTAPAWTAPPWTPPPPRPRRPRSPLGLLILSATLLLTGLLVGLHAAGVDGITVGRVLAADLAAVGLGLVAGAWWGRARWLALPAVLLAVALAVNASARVPVALSFGERSWGASPGTTYRLGLGEAVLDLGALGAGPTDLRAELGAGHLVVQVPAGVHLELRAEIAAGEALLPGEPAVDGTGLRVARTYGPFDAPLVHLDALLGAGQLEVRTDG